MQIRSLLIVVLLVFLASCDRMNGFRILNNSGTPLLIAHQPKGKTITLAPNEMSDLLLVSRAGEYEVRRPSEPACRYSYPSIEADAFPVPEGRSVIDGKSPKTLTVIAIQNDLVARAYPFRDRVPVASLAEFQRGGFPARPVRICA